MDSPPFVKARRLPDVQLELVELTGIEVVPRLVPPEPLSCGVLLNHVVLYVGN